MPCIRNVFLTVLENRRSEIGLPAWSDSGESPLPALQMVALLLCPHTVESRKKKQVLSCLLQGSGRSAGGGDGNLLWSLCLENSMDRGG